MSNEIRIPREVWDLVTNMPWAFHHKFFYLRSKGMRGEEAFDRIVSGIREHFPDWNEYSSLESYYSNLTKLNKKKDLVIPSDVFDIVKDMPMSFDQSFYKLLASGMYGPEAFDFLMSRVREFVPRWARSESYRSYVRAKNYRISQMLKRRKKK